MTLGDRCDEIVRLIDEALVVPVGPPGQATPLPAGGRAHSPSSLHPGRGGAPLTLYRRPVPDGCWSVYRPGPANRAG